MEVAISGGPTVSISNHASFPVKKPFSAMPRAKSGQC